MTEHERGVDFFTPKCTPEEWISYATFHLDFFRTNDKAYLAVQVVGRRSNNALFAHFEVTVPLAFDAPSKKSTSCRIRTRGTNGEKIAINALLARFEFDVPTLNTPS